MVTKSQCGVVRLHQMHEMLTILTDVRGVCPSVCLSQSLNWQRQCVQGDSVQPLPNAFSLLLTYNATICSYNKVTFTFTGQ